MNALIVGPGAIGSIMGFLLSESGFDVSFFHPDRKRVEELSGIKLVFPDGSTRVLRRRFFHRDNLEGEFDAVFFTVKAYQLRCALDYVLSRSIDFELLIFMQNGLGHVEIVSNLNIPRNRVFFGVTTNGGFRKEKNVVYVTNAHGDTVLAPFEKGQTLPDWLKLDWISYHPSYSSVLWTKAVVNAAVNPLTGVIEAENGRLLEERFFRIVERVVNEIELLASSLNIKFLVDSPLNEVRRVLIMTQKNRSSMLQDIENGRRTENDYITGYIVKLGRSLGIEMPANEALYNLVKIKEGANNESNTGSC